MNAIALLLAGDSVDLLFIQKLLGRLSDICQMCPFMRAFKRPLIEFLVSLQSRPESKHPVPEAAKADLLVRAGMLSLSEIAAGPEGAVRSASLSQTFYS